MKINSHVTVLGEGNFGTAFATILAHNGHNVKLWCYDIQNVESINNDHKNSKYFSSIILDSKISATDNLKEAIEFSDYIFIAIPVKFIRSILDQIKPFVQQSQILICLSKGIEQESLMFPGQIIKDIMPEVNLAIISGPSFAKELIEKKLTGVNLASTFLPSNPEQGLAISQNIKKILENDFFKIVICNDAIGLQIAGAMKNVITIGMGILDGAKYSNNSKAYLFTQGLSEINLLINKFNGNADTINSLAGVGDLVLCSYSDQSRNFLLGQQIGQGQTVEQILHGNKMTFEGLNTLQSVKQLTKKLNLTLPFCEVIYKIVFENKSIKTVNNL